uniref:Uncharacterized protein n=1 Tax=Chromera velia CCMP2878 TaxID=1169474 RepID=A0A0G4FIS7_9ALVE|eukprot:Cvel_3387.t1-p1 / transcript=Cvel_3387.t1 / gene=Cvel_3387 / organism=Chromera_velia_CCMP2878 / gene_product=hypothetical protein / transcript_product=hypothetical protein / location=Cvel_scaffold136:71403-72129(+) / protein_length=144 / sequence_SO=supercontig / SO=protein_coding / is_pseudo=false
MYMMSFGKVERLDYFKEQAVPFKPRPFGFVIFYKHRYKQRALSQKHHAMKVPTEGGGVRVHRLRGRAPKFDPRQQKSGHSKSRIRRQEEEAEVVICPAELISACRVFELEMETLTHAELPKAVKHYSQIITDLLRALYKEKKNV